MRNAFLVLIFMHGYIGTTFGTTEHFIRRVQYLSGTYIQHTNIVAPGGTAGYHLRFTCISRDFLTYVYIVASRGTSEHVISTGSISDTYITHSRIVASCGTTEHFISRPPTDSILTRISRTVT